MNANRLTLTVTGGGDTGFGFSYWTVTGPQDPKEVYGQIERSRRADSDDVRFAWYLYERTRPEKNSSSTFMLTIESSVEPRTFDDAVAEITDAWEQHFPS